MTRRPKAIANKDFKLDGTLYKKGTYVDYSKWPAHSQSQLSDFLTYENGRQMVASKDFVATGRAFKKGDIVTDFFGAQARNVQFKLRGCVHWEPKPVPASVVLESVQVPVDISRLSSTAQKAIQPKE